MYGKIQHDVESIINCVAVQYSTQVYFLILYFRKSKFRTTLAWKVIKRLKIRPFFTENLTVLKIKYFNVRILEFLILIWISATMNVCVSVVSNFNIKEITFIIVTKYGNKIMEDRFSSFILLFRQLMRFSRIKRCFTLRVEIFLNFSLVQLKKIESTQIFVN